MTGNGDAIVNAHLLHFEIDGWFVRPQHRIEEKNNIESNAVSRLEDGLKTEPSLKVED